MVSDARAEVRRAEPRRQSASAVPIVQEAADSA